MREEKIRIPVGESWAEALVPNCLGMAMPENIPGVPDIRAEIQRALANPIGSPKLRELAKGKRTAVIVVNDITRPYPGGIMVEELARELQAGGMEDNQISLVVAYGHHRCNTDEELVKMFGNEVVKRFRIIHHDAMDPEKLLTVGRTSAGIDVEINKDFVLADLKITTGCITPHQLAGYSGGRKSILPGISGMKALKIHHSFPIRPEVTSLGWLLGNPFHEQSLEAARIAGVDFILNSIDNFQKQVVQCVAGDLNEAHLAGVDICNQVWKVKVKEKPDVVIVSPGGYPRDFDLHQAQKAVGCAEVICKEGGTIILCAEMRDGKGRPGKVLYDAESVEEVMDIFRKEGYTPHANSKAYMWARAMQHFHLIIAQSRISEEEITGMFMEYAETLQAAVDSAAARHGKNAVYLAIPYASDMIPET